MIHQLIDATVISHYSYYTNNAINRLCVFNTPHKHKHNKNKKNNTHTPPTTTTTTTIRRRQLVYLYRQIHIGIPINMRLVTINAPFCLRKDVGDASEGEGFFFVNNGILVFRDDTMMMNIYKGEAFRTNGGYTSIPTCITNEPKNCCVD